MSSLHYIYALPSIYITFFFIRRLFILEVLQSLLQASVHSTITFCQHSLSGSFSHTFPCYIQTQYSLAMLKGDFFLTKTFQSCF